MYPIEYIVSSIGPFNEALIGGRVMGMIGGVLHEKNTMTYKRRKFITRKYLD
tara:strand:- start:816 stop:971 length:156 start_codon:yes stop_codon:yes gene_type:complete